MNAPAPLTIALLGAESTGKTTLAGQLAQALGDRGHRVARVPEALRAWCEREGREPRPLEMEALAFEQERLIDEAAARHDIVVADTTALMPAIHGGLTFPDRGPWPFALERLRGYGLVLLTGMDLPWVPDGLHRGGPQARQEQDALVREALRQAGADFRVVYGQGPQRLANALDAVMAVAPWAWSARASSEEMGRWARLQANCEKCGDAQCEHRLFTGLTASRT